MIPELQGLHLKCDKRDRAVEELYDVQESTGNVFRYQYRAMIVLWVSLAFNVPILNRANYVRFIRDAELELHFVSALRIGILQEQIKSAGPWVDSFAIA
jgi:hypothetical protein